MAKSVVVILGQTAGPARPNERPGAGCSRRRTFADTLCGIAWPPRAPTRRMEAVDEHIGSIQHVVLAMVHATHSLAGRASSRRRHRAQPRPRSPRRKTGAAADRSRGPARPGDRPALHRQGRGPAAAQDRPDRREPPAHAALHRPGAARAGGFHRHAVRDRARASAPPAGAAERRRDRGRAARRLSHAAARRGRRRQGRMDQRHVEGLNGPMASRGATAMCWSRTRTASGRCRTGSARCVPGTGASAAEGRRRAARAAQADAAAGRRGDDHQEGRVRHRAGPRQPASRDRSKDRRVCSSASAPPATSASSPRSRRRSSASMPTAATRRPLRPACATPTALAFHPDTGDLYAVVQERDGSATAWCPTS